MKTPELTTNYLKHLYFENRPNSPEFHLDKCNKVLGLIASLKDRISNSIDLCDEMYGRGPNGRVLMPESEYARVMKNRAIIARLKKYYNYCVSNIPKF